MGDVESDVCMAILVEDLKAGKVSVRSIPCMTIFDVPKKFKDQMYPHVPGGLIGAKLFPDQNRHTHITLHISYGRCGE